MLKEVLFVVGTLSVVFMSQTVFGWFLAVGKRHKLPEWGHTFVGFINAVLAMYILISEYAGKVAAFATSSPGEDSLWGYLAVALLCAMIGGVVWSILAMWSSYLAQIKEQNCNKSQSRSAKKPNKGHCCQATAKPRK